MSFRKPIKRYIHVQSAHMAYMDVTYMYCKAVSHTGSQAGWGPVEVFWCSTASDTARYMYMYMHIACSFNANLQITSLWPRELWFLSCKFIVCDFTCGLILVSSQEEFTLSESVRVCPVCQHSDMVVRKKKDGGYMLSCLGYPECRAVQFFPACVASAQPHTSLCSNVREDSVTHVHVLTNCQGSQGPSRCPMFVYVCGGLFIWGSFSCFALCLCYLLVRIYMYAQLEIRVSRNQFND